MSHEDDFYSHETASNYAAIGNPSPDWSTPPVYCPFCGYRGTSKLKELEQWAAVSSEDTENTATLVEWQCHGVCGGRSFWV